MGGMGYGGSPFLVSALMFGGMGGMGMGGMGHSYGGYNSHRRSWNSEDDYRWRETTQAPYFDNKVPGSESYLSAAAVVGEKRKHFRRN